ncbi:MAG: endonuclease/exonuclease/phosphatase family protein [Halanaerobiales bacterium]|nr:endonuclease/exonuclease/phosphatase family protein [Halanaerobiales bacterium]
MRKITPILVFLIILLTSLNTVMAADGITVMSYNIKHGKGMDDRVDLDRIVQIIRESGADIIGLQEVDKETSRVNGIDTPKYLAEKLGMYYVYGANMPVYGGEYGNAILSRYPIIFSKNYKLSRQALTEQRGFLLAKIKVGDKKVNFASTHLEHKENKLRVKQVKDILEITHENKNPFIIVGDFNDHAVTAPIMLMAREFNDSQSLYKMFSNYQTLSYEDMIDGKLTFPSANPQSRIDYIFLSEELVLDESIDAFKVLPSQGSDHLPLVAKIRLPFINSPKVDVGIIKSEQMQERSAKFKLPFQEGIDNASQLLEELNYSYQVIEYSRLNEINLDQVKLLILPDVRYITTPDKYQLMLYVLKGGKILALNQVGIKPDFKDSSDFLSKILGIQYTGWNYLRPLHGFISKTDDSPIWENIGGDIMMDSHDGMVISITKSGKILGEWYNDFRAMPSHPEYKNGAIIEGKNSIYIAKNLFLDESFSNDKVKQLLTNCLKYLLKD